MNRHIAQRILNDIKTSSLRRLEIASTHLEPLGAGYSPVQFAAEHFASLTPLHSDKMLIFIDGGNAEILSAPDYSVQFLRFAAVGFVNNKKVFFRRKEGYVLTQSKRIDEKLCFVAECYGGLAGGECLILPLDDPKLHFGNSAPVAVVAGVYRALLEIRFAHEVLHNGCIIVLDRALKPETLHEEMAFTQLYNAAQQCCSSVCGLSKTTSLLCNTGESVVAALQQFHVNGCWIYSPVFAAYPTEHQAVLSFVKLHSRTKYIFRFEVGQIWKQCKENMASLLASIAHDAVFVGYPYGLIAVDQFARVSNREKEYLQAMFFSHTSENFALNALNAHNVLDKINYVQ